MLQRFELPRRAIAIRQPWAWAVVHGGKDVENRGHAAIRHGIGTPGYRAVHASAGMTRREYEEARDFMAGFGVECPAPIDLWRGGIIGAVTVTGVVSQSSSNWFMGPQGLVLADAAPCEFIPCSGSLGLFEWKEAPASVVPAPARWMLHYGAATPSAHDEATAAPLPLPLFGEGGG